MGEQPNPYAPPLAETDYDARFVGEGGGLRREGDLIVIPVLGVSFPPRCVVCNQPAQNRLRRKLYWPPPGYYALICLGWIFYLVAALIVRKNAQFEVGLCEAHAARRRNGILLGWLGVPACLVGAAALADSSLPAMIALLIVAFGSTVGGLLMVRVVRASRIQDGLAWLKVGRPFLDSL